MEMNLPAYAGSIIRLLEENGYECYVVGGAVRSFLLHMPVHDYDLTTDAVPEEMKTVFRDYKTIETGLKHGTLTILSEGHPVEITTYRHDSDYSDHRHPEAVTFSKAPAATSPSTPSATILPGVSWIFSAVLTTWKPERSAASARLTDASTKMPCAFFGPCGLRLPWHSPSTP